MAEPVRTIEEFLAVARKSELVDTGRLEAAVADWPDRSQPLPGELVRRLVETELLTQWQADQLRKGRHKGFTLGKYRLRGLIGAGGMSSVYLAEHVTLHNLWAIKVLPIKRVDETSYLARFEREAQAAARLSHPNIVRASDLGTADKIHYIAMEYVDGIDLHAKVKRDGPLPLREAIDYVKQAAEGLHYAHGEGFVHRDIKPANLILDKKGVVKILDLGLAFQDVDNEDSLTIAHNEKVLGTADYLAPEQAKDSHLATARSDIYALGCTLYYLLVGRPPFARGTLAERIKAHLDGPRPNLLDDAPGVPRAIADLFTRMLDTNPEARPQTAKEIADSFDAWLRSAGPAEAGGPAVSGRQKRRRGGGPGDSGVRAAVPAAGSGGEAFRPSGDRGSPRVAPPPMRTHGGRGRPGSGIRIETTGSPKAAAASPEQGQPTAVNRSRRNHFFGAPLGLWLLGLGLLVLAGFLAYRVMNPPKKVRTTDKPPATAEPAPAAAEDADGPPAGTGDAAAAPVDAAAGKSSAEKPAEKPRPRGPIDDAIEPPPEGVEPAPAENPAPPPPEAES